MSDDLPVRCTSINPKIRVQRSPIQGHGLFAIEDITQGEWIWRDYEYKREGNPNLYPQERWHELTADQIRHQLWQFDDGKYLLVHLDDANYYHNHSCNPNSWFEGDHLVTAIRPIKKGEEVTFDYAMSESDSSYDEEIFPECRCGTALCRQKITMGDWQLPELQKRYGNHFLPYILAKIKAKNEGHN